MCIITNIDGIFNMNQFKHIITINKEENKIIINRIFENGDQHLYTEIVIPNKSLTEEKITQLCKDIGFSLLIDTYEGRELLGAN